MRESRHASWLPSDFSGIARARRPFNPSSCFGGNHCTYSPALHSKPSFHSIIFNPASSAAMASSSQQSIGSPSASSRSSTKAEKPQAVQPTKVVEPDEYWAESTMSEKNLQELRDRGLLPDPQIYKWIATKAESHPTSDTHQVAVFITHFKCGFGVYPSRFLERICRHYGIKITQMLPNAVAMLSVFAFLFEAWLGVEPYLDLWRYFYSGVWYSKNLFIRSVGFSLRKVDEYIQFPSKTSQKGYSSKWFYIQLHQENVIKGKGLMPVVSES